MSSENPFKENSSEVPPEKFEDNPEESSRESYEKMLLYPYIESFPENIKFLEDQLENLKNKSKSNPLGKFIHNKEISLKEQALEELGVLGRTEEAEKLLVADMTSALSELEKIRSGGDWDYKLDNELVERNEERYERVRECVRLYNELLKYIEWRKKRDEAESDAGGSDYQDGSDSDGEFEGNRE